MTNAKNKVMGRLLMASLAVAFAFSAALVLLAWFGTGFQPVLGVVLPTLMVFPLMLVVSVVDVGIGYGIGVRSKDDLAESAIRKS